MRRCGSLGPKGGGGHSQRWPYSTGIWIALVSAALLGCTCPWPVAGQRRPPPPPVRLDRFEVLTLQRIQQALGRTFNGWNGARYCDRRYTRGLQCNSEGRVVEMDLSGEQLTVIPSSIGALAKLTRLDMSGNQLTGIPSSIGGLTNLQHLDLSGSQLTGSIPSSIGNLTNLRHLDLTFNQLTGSIPVSIVALKKLQLLGLSWNQLNGSIPSSIGNLTNLFRLWLNGNKLTGNIPTSVGALVQLFHLYLYNNRLTGNIPTSIGALVNLWELSLSNNQLTGNIPPSIGALVKLEYLWLSGNQLTGSIPTSIGALVNLRRLDLYNHQLTGNIPTSIGALVNLQELWLNGNNLSGSIPSSIGALVNLKRLSLTGNQLTGSIPDSLGALADLEFLDLSLNQITGTIPSTLANLIYLTHLDLSQNFLGGAVPGYLGNLQKLNVLSLAGRYSTIRCPASGSLCWVDSSELPSFRQSLFCTSICPTFCNNCVPGFPNVTESKGLAAKLKQLNGSRNPYFRYASLLFAPGRPRFVDWRMSGRVFSIKDQANCSSCWAFSTIASLESAIAITYGLQPVSLSEQQLLDCMDIPENDCSGGLAEIALNYIAKITASRSLGGVFPADFYPYRASSGPCTQVSNQFIPTPIMVSMYEEVDYFGWMGIMLAVQKQPVIANLHGSYPTFMEYNGTEDIYADEVCAQGQVDHSVVIVGYNLASEPPYWIIRNSAGPSWGRSGYMNIRVDKGSGICDIQSSPVLYPVITLTKPCASPLQPCGSGVCLDDDNDPPRPGYNRCLCPAGFVNVTNIDKSTSCTPVDACNFFSRNPCGVGTCINDDRGGYNCICPLGYTPEKMASDDTATCVPGVIAPSENITYVVEVSGVTCATVADAYGLPEGQLRQENPQLTQELCLNLPVRTIIKITKASLPPTCSVRYSWSKGDTCDAVASLTDVRVEQLQELNPWLNCTAQSLPSPGAQLCLDTSSLLETSGSIPRCNKYVAVNGSDTCLSIITKSELSPLTFFQLNPGLFCDSIGASSNHSAALPPIDEVCVDGGMQGAQQCRGYSGVYSVRPRDTCYTILQQFFGGVVSAMRAANNDWECKRMDLYKGRKICIPCTPAQPGCPRAPPPGIKA